VPEEKQHATKGGEERRSRDSMKKYDTGAAIEDVGKKGEMIMATGAQR